MCFFLSRESPFCFCERHGFASGRVTAVPLGNGKNVLSVFSFRERHGRASLETKKDIFHVFSFREGHGFASARGTVVLSQEARLCFSKMERKTRFLFFFPFHAFTRGTAVPPAKAKKPVFYFSLPREARLCFRERAQPCLSEKEK